MCIMQICVFLFAGDGVNLAKDGEITGAHPQAGTALDILVFAYFFLSFVLLQCLCQKPRRVDNWRLLLPHFQ